MDYNLSRLLINNNLNFRTMNKLETILFRTISILMLMAAYVFAIIIPLGLLGLVISIENRTVAYSTLLPLLIITTPLIVYGLINLTKETIVEIKEL